MGGVMMFVAALAAAAAAAQAPAKPAVGLVVVTTDDATQRQMKYARGMLASMGGQWGRFSLEAPPVTAGDFESCEDDAPERAVECARFYVRHKGAHRADTPVVVAVVGGRARGGGRGSDWVRVSCVGPGAQASDAAAQTTEIWPEAAKFRGTRDLERDRNALAACIRAAAAEARTP